MIFPITKKMFSIFRFVEHFLGQSSLLNFLLSQVPWKWHLRILV